MSRGFMHTTPEDILKWWFSPTQRPLWYAKDADFDAQIRQRFLTVYEAARAGELDDWRQAPESLLALIIVLDQFARNMFRDSALAFAADHQAVLLTKEGLKKGFDHHLTSQQLDFLMMPLMHSELLEDQKLLQHLLTVRGQQENRFARRHYHTIARFGRFPHRNETLGRESTAEETLFIEQRQLSI
jgi:uncharacterized protein (DUF924 family)